MHEDIKIHIPIIILDISLLMEAFLTLYNRVYGDIALSIGYILFIISVSLLVWRSVWILFLTGSLVGFIFEAIGVRTGFPFGGYEYLLFKESNIFGVPIPIIFTWGIYISIAYLAASYYTSRFRWVVAASLLVILDMAIDPIMVSLGVWRWNTHTFLEWFGIPYTNFIGWFIVTAISILIYDYWNRSVEPRYNNVLSVTPYLLLYPTLVILAPREVYLAILYSLIIALIFLTLTSVIKLYRRG